MPTHEEEPLFWRDWAALSPVQRNQFSRAIQKIVADLRSMRRFRGGLRVKGVQGHPGIYEMTWASDGRATFSYGASPHSGDAHIIWRRIGTHDILQNP
jgi:hypothetical protein